MSSFGGAYKIVDYKYEIFSILIIARHERESALFWRENVKVIVILLRVLAGTL